MALKFDVTKAKELREAGKTHKQIAEILGCSVKWCERHLRGLKPKAKANLDNIVQEVARRGRSASGVTDGEIRGLVRKIIPAPNLHNATQKERNKAFSAWEKAVDTKVQAIKKSVRRQYPDAVIRPYWMRPDAAQECVNVMCEMAHRVHEFLHELADEYRERYGLDESYIKSVVHELSRQSAPNNSKLVPQGLIVRGAQLGKAAATLDERNGTGSSAKPCNSLMRVESEQSCTDVSVAYSTSELFDEDFDRFMQPMYGTLDELPPSREELIESHDCEYM